MTVTLVVMAAVAAMASAAAWLQQQRHRPVPTTIRGAPPGRLDRADFRAADASILIAVFTSETCSSCEAVWAELSGYESANVATQNIAVGAEPSLHKRYNIESVPTTVVVDAAGETEAAFVGPLSSDHRQVLRTIVARHD